MCGPGDPAARSIDGFYWASSIHNAERGWCLSYNSSLAFLQVNARPYGFSVRCVAQRRK